MWITGVGAMVRLTFEKQRTSAFLLFLVRGMPRHSRDVMLVDWSGGAAAQHVCALHPSAGGSACMLAVTPRWPLPHRIRPLFSPLGAKRWALCRLCYISVRRLGRCECRGHCMAVCCMLRCEAWSVRCECELHVYVVTKDRGRASSRFSESTRKSSYSACMFMYALVHVCP